MPTDTTNPLAGVLTATILELAEARLLHSCQRDYCSWLQQEVCRARSWTPFDVLKAWHEELDRREHQREAMRADCERVA